MERADLESPNDWKQHIEAAESLLICPVCRAGMTATAACVTCGEQFESVDGTPKLMSSRSKRAVQYSHCSADSSAGADFYSALCYPPRPLPAAGANPYHLDPAHVHVLEQLEPGIRILEIGCGGGQMRQWSSKHGFDYVGTDISKSRVSAELQSHGGPDYLCDAHFLPFRDSAFDVVYSAAVTEHIADPQLMMSEVWRVLKPGGLYLGNCSFMEPWHDDSFFHMSPLGAYRALTRAQFDVRNVWPGVGYTGFHALCSTCRLPAVGPLLAAVNRLRLTLRSWLGRPDPRGGRIAFDACVAGAVDWIAAKPLL